jgi:hypothetical protein
MAQELKAGSRWKSATDSAEVVVVRAPAEAVELWCGGHPMVPLGTEVPSTGKVEDGFADGCQVGKRYADETSGLEVLCTKPGEGSLSLGVDPLPVKGAKPLPSSD